MKHTIGETAYRLSFGFGNILEIQRLMTEAFMGEDMSQFEGMNPDELENLTMADIGNSDSVMKSMELMPKAVTQCLRGVDGTDLDDPATYVRDELTVEHGMELFNLISEQVKRLTPKKVQSE